MTGFSSLRYSIHIDLGPTQLPTQGVTGALSLGVKLLGHEADYPYPSSAEFMELYLHSPCIFVAWCLVKHRDSFTFTLRIHKHELTVAGRHVAS